MEQAPPWPRPFTSRLTRREAILVLAFMPVHLLMFQLLFSCFILWELLPEAMANLLYYAVGFLYLALAAHGLLRRDFDPLIDAPLLCLREVLGGYLAMTCVNLGLGLLFGLLSETENPNNAAVMEVVRQDLPKMKALLIYLAPFVEELLFRGGIFGLLRGKSRLAAYLVSASLFSLYHVAPYALYEPVYWIYLLQYLPVSLLLARCYERTNSVWCPIFFHMLVNGVSLSVLSALG